LRSKKKSRKDDHWTLVWGKARDSKGNAEGKDGGHYLGEMASWRLGIQTLLGEMSVGGKKKKDGGGEVSSTTTWGRR